MNSEGKIKALVGVHTKIDACRVCQGLVEELSKPTELYRGDGGGIIIVGQAPGRTEKQRKIAFSGPSGTRLNTWLVGCGAPQEDPRNDVYLTSVLKCALPRPGLFKRMAKNCTAFLHEQIRLVEPRLVISLGKDAYSVLRLDQKIKYSDALCSVQSSRDHLLLTPYGFFYDLLVWPHPSGLNHWHNESENKAHLQESFTLAKPYFLK